MTQASPQLKLDSPLLSRLRQLSPELYALDRKPLIPNDFTFPFDKLSKLLEEQFGTEVEMTILEKTWQTDEQIQKITAEGQVRSFGCLAFGLTDPLFLLFPKETRKPLLCSLLQIDDKGKSGIQEEFLLAFEAFFFSSLLAQVEACTGWKGMSPQLKEEPLPKEKGFFTMKGSARFGHYSFTFFLLLSPSFLDGLATLSQKQEKSAWISALPLIPLSLEAARIHAPLRLIKQLKPGDLILVDFPFFIPGSERARVIMTYRGIPLFRAKVKNGVVKLLEMDRSLQAFQPILSTHTTQRDNAMTSAKNISSSTSPQEEATQSLPDEEPIEELETEGKDIPQTSLQQTVKSKSEVKQLNINDLPLIVVVQLKELSMTLEQLSSLQAGNLLDLDIHPEQTTVQLVIQGHAIAEGDLVAIGDKLGVRIRSIGE